MMGYDVGLMPVISNFGYYPVSQMHRQKYLFPKEAPMLYVSQTQLQYTVVPFSPMFAHYIGLVLAAHTEVNRA